MRFKWLILFIMFTAFLVTLAFSSNAKASSGIPVHVKVGVWLVNVERVDLAANSYRVDFYLWFRFNSSEISLEEVEEFEFTNGAPSKY